jgi:superfamily I DNA/RNA helicase
VNATPLLDAATIMTWSAQQEAIFAFFEAAENHLIVRARAGTGKSTTIREAAKRLPRTLRILIAAFSKDVQMAMKRDIGPGWDNVEVATLHSVGFACIRLYRENIKPEFNSDRADRLALAACGRACPDAVLRLVAKLHTKGREIKPHAKAMGDLTSIAITFECEPDEQWTRMGFGLAYVEEKALAAMELAADVKSGDTIDGSDMIFLPVRNGWLHPQFDRVIVDEAQDMTTAQLEIARGVLKPVGSDGRPGLMAVVGDNCQAIFGFRGADSESLDRLKAELKADELGLTVTYRCGRRIVELAQAYVPDFVAGDANPEGTIDDLMIDKLVAQAGPGDFVLSRVNAPLVAIAMQLLRAGKRARVAGRDIGKGLLALMRKMKARTVPELLAKIETWAGRETARQEAALEAATNGRKAAIKAKIEHVKDQAEMLTSLCDGARGVTEVESRVEALFADDGLGAKGMITCSSVHKAKGLEADRVFILADTLRENSQEERNIAYVAITRAKRHLTWVHSPKEM